MSSAHAHHRKASDAAVPSVPLHSPDGSKAHSHGHPRAFPDRLFLPLTAAFYTVIMVLFAISVRYGDVEGERETDGFQGAGVPIMHTCSTATDLPAMCTHR
jgi:hypothetical protein